MLVIYRVMLIATFCFCGDGVGSIFLHFSCNWVMYVVMGLKCPGGNGGHGNGKCGGASGWGFLVFWLCEFGFFIGDCFVVNLGLPKILGLMI